MARESIAAGKPVPRRALRSGGVAGSIEALNDMARIIKAELAGALAARAGGLHHRLGIESVATAVTSVLLDGATACQEPGKGKMTIETAVSG